MSVISPWIRAAVTSLALMLGLGFTLGAEWRDRFADRETVNWSSGELSGNNVGATVEPDEPRHGGKRGGHSLWLSWIAPVNGLATIELEGAGYDTLLGVYQLEPGDDPELRRLEEVADNDDDRDQVSSRLQFGVRAGERYEIAVDGFAGATGSLKLRYNVQPVDALIPKIRFITTDRAATVGETVTLALDIGPGDEPDLHWYFNDEELDDEEDQTLVIPNFQPENVGQYRVRIEIDDARFYTEAVELQISSEGVITALARNKPEDAVESGLLGGIAAANRLGRVRPAEVTRGYNGTQIFHTVYAGRDVNEPNHCGVAGGASYWFSYSPPEAGDLDVDTEGSAFDTVLAVYTFEPPMLGYESLVGLTCDNDSGSDGKTSRLRFPCVPGRTYLVVVDGVNGARGLTRLNYRLTTNAVVMPPQIVQGPQPTNAPLGGSVQLRVVAEGTPPLAYRWLKDGSDHGTTNEVLTLNSMTLADGGSYAVEISNAAGSVTNTPVSVAVWGPPNMVLDPARSGVRLEFAAAGNLNVVVESSPELFSSTWSTNRFTPVPDQGRVSLPLNGESAQQFYRVRFE
jgi:hypothetical protein